MSKAIPRAALALSVLLGASIATACAGADANAKTANPGPDLWMFGEQEARPATEAASIHIYRTTKPEGDFDRIGKVSLKDDKRAYTIDEVYKAFRDAAAKKGATAIIDFDATTKLDVEVKVSDRYDMSSDKMKTEVDTETTVTVGYVGTLVVERDGAPEADTDSFDDSESDDAENDENDDEEVE